MLGFRIEDCYSHGSQGAEIHFVLLAGCYQLLTLEGEAKEAN
jgi:hypothetical protein